MYGQRTVSRRRAVRGVGLLVASGLAGCVWAGPDDAPTSAGTAVDSSDPSADGAAAEPTGGAPDLREANVVDVEFEPRDGAFRFSVTLHHDDDGEDGFANWWQVETLGGDRLGRRELLHAHDSEPFTRSETITVPEGVACVVVRGHDQTHGYGGQAMVVDLETGATRRVSQGPDRRPVEEGDCPG